MGSSQSDRDADGTQVAGLPISDCCQLAVDTPAISHGQVDVRPAGAQLMLSCFVLTIRAVLCRHHLLQPDREAKTTSQPRSYNLMARVWGVMEYNSMYFGFASL